MKNPTRKLNSIIMIFLICTILALSLIYPVAAAGAVVKAEVSVTEPQIGDTLTVNIKISNAQNLYGVDVTLSWNAAVLTLESAINQLGVESHPGGVLHESTLYPIEIITNDASQSTAQYHLLATSTGSSTPAFSGGGTIATVIFKVTGTGSTGLALQDVELSQLTADGSAELVTPSTTVDPINAAVPEFPTTIIVLLIVATTATIVISTKVLKNKNNMHVKPATLLSLPLPRCLI